MLYLDFKFLTKFVITGILVLTFSAAGIYGAEQVLVKDVKEAVADNSKPNWNCEPGKQFSGMNQELSFKTPSNDPNVTWNAPGSSNPSGKGSHFKTSYPTAGNYRVWASDNSKT